MTTPPWFPDKPKLDLEGDALLAVFTAYNECDRLPFFLDYYRRHGVSHFLAIDNGSTDGTAETLRQQKDVTYFFTGGSYAASEAGRQWTTELARHYALDHWCLTVDLDELLVFPGSEQITIKRLTEYFDAHGYQSFFTILLDMYGRGKLSEAVYSPGEPFVNVCDRYEVETYTLHPPYNFPPLQVFGGPRQRMVKEQDPGNTGPSMRKLPLMKWTEETAYVFSTHCCRPCRLADITGATLHFKFFSSFKQLAQSEVARGDRRQMGDYRNYAKAMDGNDPDFENDATRVWSGTRGLVRDGVMVSSARWMKFVKELYGWQLAGELREAQRTAESAATLTLRQLPVLWRLLNRTTFRVCEVRNGSIIAILREPAADASSRVLALNAEGEMLAESEPYAADDLVGISDGDQHSMIRIRLPESSGPWPMTIRLVLEPVMELLASLSIERRTIVARLKGEGTQDNGVKIGAACVPGDGTKLRCKFVGDRFELNQTELSIYVDGRWRGLVPLRPAGLQAEQLGGRRERRLVDVELGDVLREGSVVEAYFARRNIRLKKSPLVFSGGCLKAVDGLRDNAEIAPVADFQSGIAWNDAEVAPNDPDVSLEAQAGIRHQ